MKIRRTALGAIGATLLSAPLAIAPGTASAGTGTLWVSSAPTVAGNGTGCSAPGFNSIQAAITAAPAGASVLVCTGTYTEQLTITEPLSIAATGAGAVTVQLPASPTADTTSCDTEIETTFGGGPIQDGISICTTGTVSITGITLNAAWPANTCDDNLQGILVGGGALLRLTNSSITAAGAVPLNGCQGGIGIQVGQADASGGALVKGRAILKNVSISGYQKNGITIDGPGSSASITGVTVIGDGPTDQIAQNGIQISSGANAKIKNSTITGNECNHAVCGPNPLTDTQSVGVLLFAPAKGVSVTNTTMSDNDVGVYNYDGGTIAPVRSMAKFTADKLVANRYEGMVFDQGSATLQSSSLSNGNIGVLALQYNGQAFGANGTVSHATVSGMSVAAVEIDSDQASSGDLLGHLSISNSKISGNAATVLDNSADFVVTQSNDS
jgi:hypothetical protein